MHKRRLFYAQWSQVLKLWRINVRILFIPHVFFIDMHWRVKHFRNFENSFETSNIVTGCVNVIRAQAHLFKVLYKGELIDLQCKTMLYSKLISCNCDFSTFWCGLGEEFSKLVEVRIWSYYTSSKYLSVWSKFIIRDDHNIKHRTRLIPKDEMRVCLSYTVPRIADIVHRKYAEKSHWGIGWLKLFVIFQQKKNLNMSVYSFFQTFCLLIHWYAGWYETVFRHSIRNIKNSRDGYPWFQQTQWTTSYHK